MLNGPDEEVVEVLYNNKYVGWGIRKKVMEMYKLRNGNDNSIELKSEELSRSDSNIIQIYNELGDEFNTNYSKIRIKKIPKKYENYYYIDKYNGKECIKIDYIEYKLNNIYNKIKGIIERKSTNSNIK